MTTIVTALLLGFGVPPSSADSPLGETKQTDNGRGVLVGLQGGNDPSNPSEAGDSLPDGHSYAPVWQLAFGPQGVCQTTGYQLVTNQRDSQAHGEFLKTLYETNTSPNVLPGCPTDHSDGPVPRQQLLEEVRRVVFRRVPAPKPKIEPGRAITGMPSYLETRRDLHLDFEVPVQIPQLSTTVHITATGSYRVDWGDGTTTGPHDVPGRPWPDGTVKHTYQTEGVVDVAIHDTWQVQITVPGLLQDQLTLQPPAAILADFPVGEVESARVR